MYYNNNNHSSSFRSSQQHATYIDRNNKTLRIQKHLGSGVFGNVYKAYETNTGKAKEQNSDDDDNSYGEWINDERTNNLLDELLDANKDEPVSQML